MHVRVRLLFSVVILLTLIAGLAPAQVVDYSQDEFQYKFTLRGVTAYMYIPSSTTSVKAIFLLQENVAEQKIASHPNVRAGCDAANVAIIWCPSPFDAQFTSNAHTTLDGIQSDLNTYGSSIGYSGLGNRPLITFGHSSTNGYAQRSAEAAPEHVLAVIATHGWDAIGKLTSSPPTFANYAGPILSMIGCKWEMGQTGDAFSTLTANRGIPSLGNIGTQCDDHWMPITKIDQYGSGHFDYDDSMMNIIGMFIEKAVAARLDGSGNLQSIDKTTGWIAPGMSSAPTSPISIMSYNSGSSPTRDRCNWFFDQEFAQACADFVWGNGPWNRTYQMVWYNTSGGSAAPAGGNGFPDPVPFSIVAGTNQINIWAALQDTVPSSFTVCGGTSIGHSSNTTVSVEYECGPYVYTDAGGVRHVKMTRGSTSGYLFARHAGDSTYRRAVQPCRHHMGSGGSAPISNPGNQVCGAVVSLPNNSTSSEYVGYYVDHGPARITGSGYTMEILPIPASTSGSLEVQLYAYKLGTSGCTGLSSVTFTVSRGGTTYALTVNSGTGDGNYTSGSVVGIVADTPQSGYAFGKWTGDTDHVANPNASSTTVTMPSHAVTVTATYVVLPTYTLTVTSGTGDGDYAAGAVVNIVADAPQSGYQFSKWTGDTQYVTNYLASSTTVTMPAMDIDVTATYTSTATYALTVNSGTGDGNYAAGTVVNIVADSPPSGYQFDKWTGDTDHIANYLLSSTTVTMPSHAATVTASYVASGADTFQESGGQVVMECEHYSYLSAGQGSYASSQWELKTDVSGDSGDCMQALPNSGLSTGDGSTQGPAMNFKINFNTTGVYYYLLRMPAEPSGQDDSTNVAFDGTLFQSSVANSTGAWSWRKAATSQTVTTTGQHILNLHMREDGCIVDKIVFTTNSSYAPTGTDTGPAESSRGSGATYTLTVNSGTGDGNYTQNTVVNITADTPPAGMQFSKWVGDTANVANVNSSSTTVTMPAQNVVLTATYSDILYTLTVNSGTGDGDYPYETVVDITADAPQSGYTFSKWTGDTAYVSNVNQADTTVTMPTQDVTVTATYVAVYVLTVNSGSGDGSYVSGTVVNIVADAPQSGYVFSKWTGDTDHVANPNASSTTVTMPSHATTVTATYTSAPTYALTVNSGTGDGNYTAGTVVNIAADAPATGKAFDRWTGDTDHLANFLSANTTCTMPSHATTVTATYVDVLYTLTVNSGTGDGNYTYQQVVNISADTPPSGYAFSAWTGDVAYVANVSSSSTTVTMPAQAVTVTSTYVPTSGDTFVEASGQVVMEVEHYSDKAAGTGSYSSSNWELNTGVSGDSGDCMQVLPNNALNCGDGSTAGPVMSFKVNFSTTGVYYFYLRTPAEPSGQDDSCNVGMDGTIFQSQLANSTGAWSWRKAATSKTVSTTGLHTLNVWMREDGFICDKIVFTTNGSYAPAGTDTGPAESSRQGATTYTLTVNSGTGDGNYTYQQVVNIAADSPQQGYVFNHWSGDTATVANTNASSTTITMPAQDTVVTATYVSAPTYSLTVNSGTGSGNYTQSQVVNISANTPPTGYSFDHWTGDTANVASTSSSSTTITMPAATTVITALYKINQYTLTVNSGTGGGTYNYQQNVNISANTPPTGYSFDHWTGDTANVANTASSSTTITMPAATTVITALYKVNQYTLTVTSGTGSGTYDYQQNVNISADTPPNGYVFDHWTGDTSTVANTNASSTTITMPASNAAITALYKTGSGDTFQESSGQVVMEVENYSSKAAGTGSYTNYNWTLVTNVSGDSGDSMQVQPNNGTNCTTNAGCVMNFKINFSTTGNYYVYCRMPGLPSADNKINYGMDGTLSNYWTQADTSNWQWKKSSAISVTSTGVRTLNLWQKLDGAICDKLVMTTNSSYAPAGSDTGPAESSKQ